jgi:hypothetical protein
MNTYRKLQNLIKLSMLGLGLSALLLTSCSDTFSQAQRGQKKSLWDEEAYFVTIDCDANYENPSWGTRDSKGKHGGATNAQEVIKHFSTQPDEKKKRGIFIYSFTYRVPDTEEEKSVRPTRDWKLYYNKAWRKAEAQLIQDLVTACKKEKIKVYVNLTSNMVGEWEQLSP